MSNLLHLTRQALHAPPALTRSYASASKKIAFQKPQANAFNRLRTAAPRGGSSASPKATKQPSHTPTPKPTTPAPANSLDYSSLESQLARLGSEKLLYAHKAPGFLFAAYSMAAGSFVYAAYTFDLTRQGEVAKWVRATSWVGICGGTLLGALAVYYPTRYVPLSSCCSCS